MDRVFLAIAWLSLSLLTFCELGAAGTNESMCENTTTAHSVIENTFRTHVDFVRMGVGHDLVEEFYNHALLSLSREECVCGEDEIALPCIENYFLKELRNATLDLWWVVMDDWDRQPSERLFPDLLLWDEIPGDLTELEKRTYEVDKSITESEFGIILQRRVSHNESADIGKVIVQLPNDEEFRIDKDKEKACIEFDQKMSDSSLTLSATSLTAYTLGVAHQMVLSSGGETLASYFLQEHVRLVYNAARCTRLHDEALQIPTVYLDHFVTTAHLVLLNASVSLSTTLLAGLPPLTAMSSIVRISRKHFPRLIQRLSGLGSSGKSMLISWTGTELIVEESVDVLVRNLSISEVNALWGAGVLQTNGGSLEFDDLNGTYVKQQPTVCPVKFRWVDRLDEITDLKQNCCSESCLREDGNVFDVKVLNEMCCKACNEYQCDVTELTKVLQVQANWVETSKV